MQIIKTGHNQFIKPETETSTPSLGDEAVQYFIWGWRWNKNEQRWGTQLTGHWFKSFEWVEEGDLPTNKGIY